jgi:hypothetical protein
MTPAQRYASMLGMEKVKVIRFGSAGKEEYDIDNRKTVEDESVLEIE